MKCLIDSSRVWLLDHFTHSIQHKVRATLSLPLITQSGGEQWRNPVTIFVNIFQFNLSFPRGHSDSILIIISANLHMLVRLKSTNKLHLTSGADGCSTDTDILCSETMNIVYHLT